MTEFHIDRSARRHRLPSMIIAGLFSALLMAAILVPAGHGADSTVDAWQYDRASGPLREWLADELRNRHSLRIRSWNAAEPDDEPDAGDPFALLRAGIIDVAIPAVLPDVQAAANRLRCALLSLISPRGPPTIPMDAFAPI